MVIAFSWVCKKVDSSNIIGDMSLPEAPRVVLDTNVLVAAARSAGGASFSIVRAVPARRFELLVSVPLMVEYEAVLKRPEHMAGRRPHDVEAFLTLISRRATPVLLHTLWRPQARDPADDMVLETALNGRADALVTFNQRDLARPARLFKLPVYTPGAFWQALQMENPHG
ncbi:putative toxin-antitoxin system toxin component, PIN family [Comamonadaceae bacterium OH2545_COT-014]|nr:putative toxin-antitoxin system toxin component, PIN family [Comamonadaceae bacterium OH2545_COT-014]